MKPNMMGHNPNNMAGWNNFHIVPCFGPNNMKPNNGWNANNKW